MSSPTSTDALLPTVPARRAEACPLAPPPEFTQWRDEPGMRRATNLFLAQPTWVASRYEDIRAALTDPRMSAMTIPDAFTPTGDDDQAPVIFPRTDDPEHNRLRRMLTRDFTARRAKEQGPEIQRLVDDLIDKMIATGPPSDFVRDFALPVPSLVICLLLGVPYEDHDFFQDQSTGALDVTTSEEDKVAAIGTMFGYISQLLERKKREPGDDLLSRLMNDNVANGEMSVATAAMTGFIMLQAGHETTASMIALGTLVLLQHPEAMARLRQSDDPAVALNIVDELLRYLTIVHGPLVDRVATEDMELGGQTIRRGEHVAMNLVAGNWDPDFVDNPEVFDPDRNPRGHLAFGYGVHQCIGHNLARTELQIALTTVARRLPGLALAVPFEELNFMEDQAIYRLETMPVTW
ncbi:cytochrome [Mycolicibacterium moriokaense]|uniref:Steroid C26-monooxygenase n=1 Tax=Mycolicibacterium moriokaense TaxID=39691 RepID=A0AAD1HG79_9MYCO|nr:cytochrome P450 [Mycolicibacterium moriokaense]MCV7042132.1 cytochrome P450 [Mycolicibacterium moriokaense]ORB25198.1 cytochrome [Mycolicibacterium moriokaense]BBX04902.1 cytochrome P450 [Mycolicibacterium moriokaense]